MQRVCVGQASPVNQTGGYGKGFPAACSLTTEYRGSKDQSDLAERHVCWSFRLVCVSLSAASVAMLCIAPDETQGLFWGYVQVLQKFAKFVLVAQAHLLFLSSEIDRTTNLIYNSFCLKI
jgi:hypothetical protein